MMKSFVRSLAAAALVSLTAVGAQAETLSVAATPVPHAELLEFVKPALKKEGVDLKIRVFNDYVQPIQATADKAIDANFFLHRPYLDTYNKERKPTTPATAAASTAPGQAPQPARRVRAAATSANTSAGRTAGRRRTAPDDAGSDSAGAGRDTGTADA